MEILLLTDIRNIGRKGDLLSVSRGFAMNHLLPLKKGIVATPAVRKQYAEHIKKRAEERENEKALQTSLKTALTGVIVHLSANAAKNGKLYASIGSAAIIEALKSEHNIDLSVDTIEAHDHLKTIGKHTVQVTVGTQTVPLALEISAQEKEKAAA